jgi:glycosyltransferase involved in cell wall biosynthesis
MPGLLASGEIAIFPSLMEATSVAALEAMACERPVLATDVGGLPEIVEERVGGLVPPRDPGGLARGVVRLLRDPHLVEKGQIARERVVTHWSNARLVDRHLEIYEDLIAGREVRSPSIMQERGAG